MNWNGNILIILFSGTGIFQSIFGFRMEAGILILATGSIILHTPHSMVPN
jgi:hypothetical protein